MKYLLPGFLLLLAGTAAVSLGYFYWKFRHAPASIWARRVRRRLAELQSQLQPPERPTDTQARGGQLGRKLFQTHLQSVPSSAVLGFPGVGPSAVERIQSAGLRSLAQLIDYDYERIPGFGPVKAGDMKAAVRKLLSDAKARFEAGACPEGREYQTRWAEMTAADRAERERRLRANAAVERAIAQLRPTSQLANDVAFWNHLLHKGDVPGLTGEIMARPLPEVVVEPPVATVIPVLKPVVPEVHPVVTLAAKRAGDTPVSAPVDLFQQALRAIPATAAEHALLPKLRAYCAFAFVVAKADGRIAKSERAEVRELLAGSFGHDSTLVRFIDPVMEQTERNIPDEDDTLAEILRVTTAGERRMLYAVAETIADAAGGRGAREVDALRRMAKALGVSDVATSFQLVDKASLETTSHSPQSEHFRHVGNVSPRQILEIDPTATVSPDLIRRRYLLLTERADPAKAAALGAEFAAMAEAKRAGIRRAAEELLAPFGELLTPPAAPAKPSDIRHNPDLDDVFGG